MPYLCLHGHFYQPPRENPWTDEIDREPSAAPFHNWNERINEECYRANAFARVLAADGRVVDILNNYEYLSFNFGPTLLSWIRVYAPDVYERIRQGDAVSRARLGHGNALAQVYNHLIMPLASRRDKETQVAWGLADFRCHFGREAEAMWLPETAVDEETLEVLAEVGMRFVILAPAQAARIRPLSGGEWQPVSNGAIDPSRAYLCRLPSGRSIACFFYDGVLAHGASFGDALSNSETLVHRLRSAVDPARPHAARQLIHFATDGETYGHHKQHAERTLIYAFTHLAPQAGFQITNYATYLEIAPPEWEVQIQPNTSWSCIHGLGRWSDDCGCHTGRVNGGHQRWRAPLRTALNRLSNALAELYEREADGLLGPDPWAARNAYGDVLAHRTPERIEAFLTRQAGQPLSREQTERALTLLEMQKHALFMFTSCGWFFDDISGHEAVQVLKYAARAIDLASRFDAHALTRQLLADLEQAPSNVPPYRHGADVYWELVLPVAIKPQTVAANHAIAALVHPFPVRYARHGFRVEQTFNTMLAIGQYALVCGHVRLTSEFTEQVTGWTYAALHLDGYNFAASVVYCEEAQDGRRICALLQEQPSDSSTADLMRVVKAALGPTLYGLGDLPPSDRRRLLKVLDEALITDLAKSYQQIYTQHLGTIAALREAKMTVPPELRVAAEYTLSHQLAQAVVELTRRPDEAAEASINRILDLARRDQIPLDRGEAIRTLEKAVVEGVRGLASEGRDQLAARCAHLDALIAAADRLGFEVRPARAQEMLLHYLRTRAGQTPVIALQLAERLRISPQAVTYRGPADGANP